MQQLEAMSTGELVDVYNGLGPERPLKSWKQSKSKLIDRIVAQGYKPEKSKPRKGKTVKEACVSLLTAVSHRIHRETREIVSGTGGTAADYYTVGLSYKEILDCLKEEFPDAKTTVECLRWYAVKIRAGEPTYEDLQLPQIRPRPPRR